MKLVTLFTFVLFLQYHVYSQSKPNKKSDWEKAGLKGKVESIEEKTYSLNAQNGSMEIDTVIFNPRITHYNKTGFITEETTYQLDGKIAEKWNYTFDIKNNPIAGKRYDDDGNILWHFNTKYDDKGNEIEITKYEEGGLIETNSLVYDANGNCIEISSQSEPLWKENFKYDSLGNNIERNYTNVEGIRIGRETYKYNENNIMIERIKYGIDDSFIEKETYKYDKNGNQIEYNYFSVEGILLGKETYAFDSKDNVIEHKSFRADGTLDKKILNLYTYDKQKNWIVKTGLENGKASYMTRRVVKYY